MLLNAIPTQVQVALAIIGGVFALTKAINFIRFVANVFILPGTSIHAWAKPGTWVLITSASDGIGKEFALQLAAKGLNLVLVSRTQSKLDALVEEITDKYSVKKVACKTLAMDYSRDDEADYDRLRDLVSDLDIGVLINSVGQSHSIPVPFIETADLELQNIVTINCLGTLKVTRAVVPAMISRYERTKKRGLILTMGSFGGWTPTPLLATYSGSKAFLQQWSLALHSELQGKGVDVQFILSYLVTGAMSKIRRPTLMIPPPKPFVRAALAKIRSGGWSERAHTYVPYWTHALLLYVVENTIGALGWPVIEINRRMHEDIRVRALRKAAREAKRA